MAEQLTLNQRVEGSSPSRLTSSSTHRSVLCAAGPPPQPYPRRTSRAALIFTLAVLLTGCGTQLRTEPSPGSSCGSLLQAIQGVLKSDAVQGLGLEKRGTFVGVVWPYGYSATRDRSGLVLLLDRDGQVVAREGDTIVMSGVHRDDGFDHACDPPELRVGAHPVPAV